MKTLFSVLFFLCHIPAANCQLTKKKSQSPYFQQDVNYKIKVTLNDTDNTLDGSININYTNNSPDTLTYLWFHLWPNAFKNDKTAFSDQLLQNGRTDFYFSDNDKKGYINRLNFNVNGLTARLEDHPAYIDIAKLVLPVLLRPGQIINITSPFHVKLPYNFSRGGYVGRTYQITQWYPKPAVYDNKGWHPMPYLDQGEFYSEFGTFDVEITLPKDYVVAATGDLQNEEEKNWLAAKSKEVFNFSAKEDSKFIAPQKPKKPIVRKVQAARKPVHKTVKGKLPLPTSSPQIADKAVHRVTETKTLHYIQNDVHDFAWFANKNFIVRMDTLQLASGRIIKAQSFFTPQGYAVWQNSLRFIKDAVRTRSEWLGEYPYNVITAIEAKMGFNGGMEYPTITSISPMAGEKELDLVIEHEVGHNWNYGILASNEREHPWMDEGMNTYFDKRYIEMKYAYLPMQKSKSAFVEKRVPDDAADLAYRTQASLKKDQPVETVAEAFSEINYNLVAYYKTGQWMKTLETFVGEPVFDSCLHIYFRRWKFKHPYPEDFKKVVEEVSGKNVDSIFSLLNTKGGIVSSRKKTMKLFPLFNFKQTNKFNYVFISPAFGANYYDKLMIGGLIHNYTLPLNRFQFLVAPMYGIQSKKLAGLARVSYNLYSYGLVRKAEISLSGATFSMNDFTDSVGNVKYLGFKKFVPSLKIIFKEKNSRSNFTKWLQWKTFFIQEQGLLFSRDTVKQIDIVTYPQTGRYLNQLKFVIENHRVLYPFIGELQAEQGEGFVRTVFNGNYFFNYIKRGGLNVRLFAGKFLYLGDKTLRKQFATDRYHLNMTGANGYEDYTYSNYFAGRSEFTGWPSQQIIIRDGGFKVRSDLLASKIGKTDDWLAALNFKSDIPKNINPLEALPVKIPLKLFLDVGTYAEAWDKNAATGKFVYDAGFQLSLLNNLVNIYIPVAYSKVYSDYFKSTITDKRFLKNISFSIDIQNFSLKSIQPQIPF